MCGVLPQQDINAIAVRAEDCRERRQPWPRSPNVRSAQNLWMDLSVAQILATVADSDSFGDAGCIARDLARSASRPIRMSSGSIRFASNTAVAKLKPSRPNLPQTPPARTPNASLLEILRTRVVVHLLRIAIDVLARDLEHTRVRVPQHADQLLDFLLNRRGASGLSG